MTSVHEINARITINIQSLKSYYLRDHLQMFDQVLIEFDRKYSVKIN